MGRICVAPQGSRRENSQRTNFRNRSGLGRTISPARRSCSTASRDSAILFSSAATCRWSRRITHASWCKSRNHSANLCTGLAGTTQVIAKGDPLPDFDFQCPLPSLPLAFKTRLETIPSSAPYLRVSTQIPEHWEKLLGPKRSPRIGLAWAGNAKHVRDGERSMAARSPATSGHRRDLCEPAKGDSRR